MGLVSNDRRKPNTEQHGRCELDSEAGETVLSNVARAAAGAACHSPALCRSRRNGRARYGESSLPLPPPPDISFKYWCTNATAIAPSPTAEATRLMEPERMSPAASTPGRLVSSR